MIHLTTTLTGQTHTTDSLSQLIVSLLFASNKTNVLCPLLTIWKYPLTKVSTNLLGQTHTPTDTDTGIACSLHAIIWIYGDSAQKGGRGASLNHIFKIFQNCDISKGGGVNNLEKFHKNSTLKLKSSMLEVWVVAIPSKISPVGDKFGYLDVNI